jgi:uncharacterized membrane protein
MLRTFHPEAEISVGDDNTAIKHDSVGPRFGFVMTPHRSMSDRTFRIVIVSVLAISLGAQLFFVAIGVWVAAVAALFDGLFLAGAFIASRNDRRRMETLRLEEGLLTSVHRRGNGEIISSEELPAFGLTLRQKVDRDYGCLKLEIVQGGRLLHVASELSASERSGFAAALIDEFRKAGIAIRIETS